MKKLTDILKKTIFFRPEYGKGFLAAHWLLNLVFLLLWCCGCGIVGLYLAKVGYGPELFQSYLSHGNILVLNLLPGLMAALLLLFITGRVWPAVVSGGVLSLGLAVINYYKLLFRDDPVLFTDIMNINEAAQISGGYSFTVPPAIILSAVVFVAAIVFAAVFMRLRIRKAAVRILGSILVLAACAGLYAGVYSSDEIYEETEYLDVEFAAGYRLNRWNEGD